VSQTQNDPREVAASAGRKTQTVCTGFTRRAPASSRSEATLSERAAAVRDCLRTPEAFGLSGFRQSGSGWLGPCPLHEDGNPSFSVRSYDDGIGWTCFSGCGKGDAIELVARRHGLETRGADFARVVEIAEGLAGITPGRAPRPVVVRAPKPERVRLDAHEVAALWAACIPADEDDEVAAWIRSRGIALAHLVDRDLARALRRDAKVPAWAQCGRPWTATGHRLVVPTFDARGRMVSCQARAIVPHRAKAVWPKSPTPETLVAHGVFADPLGRMLLATGEAPDWWQGPMRVEICEGIPDTLTLATMFGDDETEAPAVLGFASGAWTREIADRIPDGAEIIIWEHRDSSGTKFTDHILHTMKGRRVDVRVVDGWSDGN
jgi:CHC2 zinc finger